MPNHTCIILPKSYREHKRLPVSTADTYYYSGQIEPSSSNSQQKKLPVVKTHFSSHISPPQVFADGLLDEDDDNQRLIRRSTSTRYQRSVGSMHRKSRSKSRSITAPSFISAPAADLSATKREEHDHSNVNRGQTLFHLATKLGHEEIVRILLNETSHANELLNKKGQTPLLCAIEAGSTATAILLMEHDPLSLTYKDQIDSSVFHYSAEQCNDIVLSRAISLLKQLSSSSARLIAVERLVERNSQGKTPFVIAIEKGSLKCVKCILTSKWLRQNINISNFINADSLKTTIDQNQLDIAAFFVSDIQRFAAIIQIVINANDRIYNVLEYSIALRKADFVRIFISVRIPNEYRELYRTYKHFLKHYNVAYSGSNYNQTPIQRMLTTPEMVPLVPLLLEQFISEDAIDFSIIDDCLRACPAANRCLFGHTKRFSSSDWLKQHPLSLIAESNYAPVYDHDVVKTCVDLKFELFGNFLYFLTLCSQIFFVFLYTGVALASPTPVQSYYDTTNYTCQDLCHTTTLDRTYHRKEYFLLRTFRFLLFVCSSIVLSKEIVQLILQREKYLRDIFIKILELITYTCAILFSMDLNKCTRRTGLRCKWQWECGAVGIVGIWTLFLFMFMNSMKIGKYGLLFVSVFLTFLKFCLIYVFIWIGYIIAFYMLFIHKRPQFTHVFYSIPKTIAMLTGEYDFDDLFFTGSKVLQGSEVAMVIYSIFVFSMNIVIMNIMVGLAVSDVKRFRLNAKREHLRARIETCLGLQAKFGLLCETCSRLVLTLSKHSYFLHFQMKSPRKYYLWKLELRKSRVELPEPIQENFSWTVTGGKHHSIRDHVTCEIGYYRHRFDRAGQPLLHENEQTCFMHKIDELRDVVDKVNTSVHHELRKLAISLQMDIDEIKRKLIEN